MKKVNVKIDASAFKTLFASLDERVKSSVNAALFDESKRILDDAYSRETVSRGFVVPTTIDALPMRKNADGVFVLNKRATSYVSEQEARDYFESRKDK